MVKLSSLIESFIGLPDANIGRSQGTIKPRFTGAPYKRGKNYPYIEPDEEEYEDLELRQQTVLDNVFSGDEDDLDKFIRKVNLNYMANDPTAWRADRTQMSNMRLDLMEKFNIGATSGISPFSARKLYGKFQGPPLGGGGAGQAFRTTGPYRKSGTLFGTSRASFLYDDGETTNRYTLADLLDPSDPALNQNKKRTQRIKKIQSNH